MTRRRLHRGLLAGAAGLAAACVNARAAGETAGTAIDVAAGMNISCAAQATGQVVCWGLDVFARYAENKVGTSRPFRIAGLEGAKQVALGDDSLCAVDGDGGLRCIGSLRTGSSGQPYGAFKLD